MKKIVLLVALSLGVSLGYSQKVKEAEVPAAVKESFVKHYPNTKVEKWEKEGSNFEAEFESNKVETSVLFDAAGNIIETEIEINIAALPKAASEYVSKNMPGKKIKEASKITDAKGKVTYEAEVDNADYIFDANGNFIKKEVEKDDDTDKD